MSPAMSRSPQAWVVQPGRVGLRIEVHEDLAALEARQPDLVPVLVGEVERGRPITGAALPWEHRARTATAPAPALGRRRGGDRSAAGLGSELRWLRSGRAPYRQRSPSNLAPADTLTVLVAATWMVSPGLGVPPRASGPVGLLEGHEARDGDLVRSLRDRLGDDLEHALQGRRPHRSWTPHFGRRSRRPAHSCSCPSPPWSARFPKNLKGSARPKGGWGLESTRLAPQPVAEEAPDRAGVRVVVVGDVAHVVVDVVLEGEVLRRRPRRAARGAAPSPPGRARRRGPRSTTIGVAQISHSAIQHRSSSWNQGVIRAASHRSQSSATVGTYRCTASAHGTVERCRRIGTSAAPTSSGPTDHRAGARGARAARLVGPHAVLPGRVRPAGRRRVRGHRPGPAR